MSNKFNVLDNGLFIKKISKTYGNKQVVRDITISIKRNEIVGLLGPNGAGKTTTFYIIVGLVKPDSGSIVLDKLEVSNLPIYLRGKLGISYLPQEASIFRDMFSNATTPLSTTIPTDRDMAIKVTEFKV